MTVYRLSEEAYAARQAKRARDEAQLVVAEVNARDRQIAKFSTLDRYALVALFKAEGLPEPTPEYAFAAPARKWRSDYCWIIPRIIVEIDGAIWTQGRHTRPQGYLADMEKLNAATMLGYRVLRYGPHQLAECVRDVRRLLA